MNLFQYVAALVLPMVGTGLTWLLVQGAKLLLTRITSVKLADAVRLVEHFAELAVAEVEASLRPQMASVKDDGRVDWAEAVQLKSAAVALMKSYLGAHGLELILSLVGIALPQLDSYLGGFVEKANAEQPSDTRVPAPVVAAPPSLTAAVPK